MLDVRNYSSLEEAFDSCMIKDIDHVLIRHSYKKGTRIYPHRHNNADEYVITTNGHFKVESEGDEKTFNLDTETVTVIYYPAGREHGLEVIGEKIDYFVLRKRV
jgi:quercetin dioxygenase-like cupin family protein